MQLSQEVKVFYMAFDNTSSTDFIRSICISLQLCDESVVLVILLMFLPLSPQIHCDLPWRIITCMGRSSTFKKASWCRSVLINKKRQKNSSYLKYSINKTRNQSIWEQISKLLPSSCYWKAMCRQYLFNCLRIILVCV